MTREAEIGILANLKRLQAQDRIERGDFNKANYENVYQLYMLAYEDEELAQRVKSRSAELHMHQQTRKE